MFKKLNKLRMWQWMLFAIIAITAIAFIAPQQLGILLLKCCYLCVALVIGYYADRFMYPYARPHEMAKSAWQEQIGHNRDSIKCEAAYQAYVMAMLRRAIIVGAVVIAFALGL